MKLELKDPQTGRQVEVQLPDWKMLLGMMNATVSFPSLASIQILSAMLANPKFEPAREDGEDAAEAYARRAVDYAEALEKELHRRERTAAAATKEPTP